MRPLHAVLVERATPRLVELLAAALDGRGPAIAPIDAGLPAGQLDRLVAALAPDTIEDAEGVTTVRSGGKAVAEGTAVVVGTSGSTGAPKGAELSAAALRHSARASLDRVGARPGERWLCCLPATHVAGLMVLVRSLVGGTDPVLAEQADAGTLAAAAAAGCAHVSLVPTQLQRLFAPGRPAPLTGFSSVLLGGAAAPDSLLGAARAAGVPVVTTYGMTETCGGCVYDGVPLDGVRVMIRGEDDRPAETGRIWIGGPVLFSGYRPSRPGEAVSLPQGGSGGMGPPGREGEGVTGEVAPPGENTFFRTGDLGRMDSSGRLTVRGRADDVINTGGHKVIPGEVAAVLQACPGVRDAAVVGRPDPEWGERIVAVVVPADPAHPPALELLRLHVRERLPRYAAPSTIVTVDAVPMLPSGKHDIVRLRQELLRREQTEAESVTT
ncbi:MAG: AMP-binding protein [Actinobacteria bacterium]|nr:AMP-binding protein [Actinomycetota bacterium]